MKSKYIILFFFVLLFGILRATHITDSLETVLSKTSDINQQFLIYGKLFRANLNTDHKKAALYLNNISVLDKKINSTLTNVKLLLFQAQLLDANDNNNLLAEKYEALIPLLKKLNLKDDLGDVYGSLGRLNMNLGNYDKAIQHFLTSDSLARETNNLTLQCESAMFSGRCYGQMANNAKAIQLLQKALGLSEQLKNRRLQSKALLIMGSIYSEGPNHDYSVKYLDQAEQIALEDKDTTMLINVYTYKANSYYYDKQYKEALKIYESLKGLCLRYSSKQVYAGTLGNMANVYSDMGDNKKGLELQLEASRLFEELGDKQGMTICYCSIGTTYYYLKDYQQAIAYYQKAIPLADEMHTLEDMIEIYSGLTKTYEALGDYKKAYENYQEYSKYNDSTFNSDNTKKITELELNYQFENKQKEIALQRALEEERFKRFIYLAVGGILLLLVIVVFIYRNNRQRKKANEQLQASNKEILKQQEELRQKTAIIEIAYDDIKSSINYAKRIQEAILPIKDEIKKSFESFILFKPRDVVSGDFYWFAKHNNKHIIACVDCTGHGVPGAFMSMIGNTLLNEIVNEKGIEQPSDILNLLHIRVRQSLKQDLENTETRDGMDISVCTIDTTDNTLQYAGANRPLFIIRDGKLEETKPDKMSIGGHQMQQERIFTNHAIELKKGDAIYLTSDGYADQFGGERGKKFMVKRFHQTLLEINSLSMYEQGIKLKNIIEQWQGNIEQIDDILVIGMKIN